MEGVGDMKALTTQEWDAEDEALVDMLMAKDLTPEDFEAAKELSVELSDIPRGHRVPEAGVSA